MAGRQQEPIIMEGVCYKRGIYSHYVWAMLLPAVVSVLGIVVGIPIALCLAAGAVKTWRLYLTPSAIHYHYQGHCCSQQSYVIPLSYVKDAIYTPHDNNVSILMEASHAYEFIGSCDRPLIWSCIQPENIYVHLLKVANGEEFAQAVKRQISASA